MSGALTGYGEYGYAITLTSGQEETGNDFVNYEQATKSGTKYNDLDADGEFNGSDVGLSGWTIYAFADDGDVTGVLDASDTLVASTNTDGSGDYTLTLDPGDYIIVEGAQSGWFESPASGTTEVNDYATSRITSYNVCYTKLLRTSSPARNSRSRYPSPPGPTSA